MNENDAERFAEMLAGVGETYNQTVSPLRHGIYFRALMEFDYEVVSAAMMRHVQTSKFFPTPADIREQIDGSDSDREGVAWSGLTQAINIVGPYKSLIVQDPVVAAAICMTFGSWPGACEARRSMYEAQWHARRKDFGAAMRTARRDAQIRQGGPRLLTGISDAENRASRAAWAEGAKMSHHWFGVLQEGKVEEKRLALDERTLLPAMSLREALALPPAEHLPLMLPAHQEEAPVDPEFLELSPEQAAERFREKFAEMMKAKGLSGKSSSVQAEGRDDPESVSAAEAAPAGDAARSAAAGGEDTGSDRGVSVREGDRSEVVVRSGLAGSHDRDGDRGRSVRKRGARRPGRMDEVAREDHSAAAGRSRKARRSA